jgi:hypothetical protein
VAVAPIPLAQTIAGVDLLATNRLMRVQLMAVEVDVQDADAPRAEETDNELTSKGSKAESLH